LVTKLPLKERSHHNKPLSGARFKTLLGKSYNKREDFASAQDIRPFYENKASHERIKRFYLKARLVGVCTSS